MKSAINRHIGERHLIRSQATATFAQVDRIEVTDKAGVKPDHSKLGTALLGGSKPVICDGLNGVPYPQISCCS